MTDEQIKQNAEEYADALYDRKYQNELWRENYGAHIAGAHSRDEEIKVMSKAIKSCDRLIRDYNKSMRAIIDYKRPSPWHPYPAEKPPQIRPEISTKVLAHVPWGECCSCYYKDGEWKGCPDLWAKKIDKWMEIPE